MSLIQRLEALTGPDRDVDMQVALAVGHEAKFIPYDPHSQKMLGYGWIERSSRNSEWNTLALYTASIDAALTLFSDEETAFRALYEVMCWFATEGPIFKPTLFALNKAICIAALKARGVK